MLFFALLIQWLSEKIGIELTCSILNVFIIIYFWFKLDSAEKKLKQLENGTGTTNL